MVDLKSKNPMIDRIPALEGRIANIEGGQKRIESLIENQVRDLKEAIRTVVTDLKQEQIADIKDDLKGAQDEIIVQRNLIYDLQKRDSEYKGGLSVLHWVSMAIGTAIGIAISLASRLVWK